MRYARFVSDHTVSRSPYCGDRAPGSMQQNWLTHQGVIAAEELIDLLHGGLIGDELVDVATEVLCQQTGNKDFTLAALVDDFVAAETQCFEFVDKGGKREIFIAGLLAQN